MRSFFLTTAPVLVWVFTAAEILLGILSFRSKKRPLNLLCGALCCGLAFDALIISLGTILEAGPFLQTISQIRFILHGLLVPLMIPIPFYGLGIQKKSVKWIVWAVTAILMLCGIVMGILTVTEPVEIAGILRYKSAEASPAFSRIMDRILSFGGVIPLILVGLIAWIKRRKPQYFLGGLLMFAFSALGPATRNSDLIFFISMIGELSMVLCFWLAIRKTE